MLKKKHRESETFQTFLLKFMILQFLFSFTTKHTLHSKRASPNARIRDSSDQKRVRSVTDESGNGVAARKRFRCYGIRSELHCGSHRCNLSHEILFNSISERVQSVRMVLYCLFVIYLSSLVLFTSFLTLCVSLVEWKCR